MSDSAENNQTHTLPRSRLFYQGWVILLLIVAVAAFFRFYQFGEAPPGLYRDEAHNGLDALDVLAGNRPIFFESNNGREPLYIYLVALSVKIFGRTALAVRLPAAIVGTLATITTYWLTKSWFDKRTALIAAALWATTLWPIHLSRVGFRTILLPLTFSFALYLLTNAYRQQSNKRFFVAGLAYGLIYYTYLASRLTPLVLVAVYLYMWMVQRKRVRNSALFSFISGTVLSLLPLALYILQNPDSAIGRTGQVSILSPAINNNDLWGTLINNVLSTAGMFFIQGDTIMRHNPFGRTVFDWIIAIPFIIGVLFCLWHWRKPAPAVTLICTATMLIGTILAEDAPHFLRSAGVLPILLIFPAVGLSQLLSWSTLPSNLQLGLICLVLVSSSSITFNDYFVEYAQQADTYYLFEAAVQEMAKEAIQDDEDSDTYIDQRFQEGWSSMSYLLDTSSTISYFQAQSPPNPTHTSYTIYASPVDDREFINDTITPPAHVTITAGGQVRGDLEPEPHILYVRYGIQAAQELPVIANFNNQYFLHAATTNSINSNELELMLTWSSSDNDMQPVATYVHIIAEDGVLIGQLDAPPGGEHWFAHWWQPNIYVHETRSITLSRPYNATQDIINIGVYNVHSLQRMSLLDDNHVPIDDHWQYER